MRVARNDLVRGALKLIIELDQVTTLDCVFTQYRSSYRIRPFTNSNSAIEFHASAGDMTHVGAVTGTAGIVTLLPNKVVAFGLSNTEPASKMQVTSSNGQTASIVSGQVALASKNGIKVITPEAPSFTVFWGGSGNGKVLAPTGFVIEVNGRVVRSGEWVSNLNGSTVRVSNLAGDDITQQVFWPGASPRNQR